MQSGAPDELLFKSESGSALHASNCRRAFEAALAAANLKHVTIHSLRHTYTSTMLAAGESIKRVQHDLGHSSITMTMDTYGHLIPDGSGEALLRAKALFGGRETGMTELRWAE
jgi:integrase